MARRRHIRYLNPKSMELAGGTQHISAGSGTGLSANGATQGGVRMVVKFDDVSNNQMLMYITSNNASTTYDAFYFRLRDDSKLQLILRISNINKFNCRTTTTLSTGTWYDIIVQKLSSGSNRYEIWINGVKDTLTNIVGSQSTDWQWWDVPSTNREWMHGVRNFNSILDMGLDGKFDIIQYFTVAKTEAEIQVMHNNFRLKSEVLTDNVVDSFRFADNTIDEVDGGAPKFSLVGSSPAPSYSTDIAFTE